jgi:uncharacterized membrane protein
MLYIAIKVFPVALLAVVALDLLWLGVIMKNFYFGRLGHLLSGSVVWPAAIAFYFIFAAALTYFAVLPGIEAGSLLKAALLGAVIGFVAYSTYDLTNHATMKNWPLAVTVVDILWGAVLSATAASAGYLAVGFLSR